MPGYKELVVWQKSMDMVVLVYRIVKCLPREENYALGDQMRRASVSIPSNIAEGHGRNSIKEFIRYLLIAQGSRAELETQLEICLRLQYLTAEQVRPVYDICGELGRMLCSLIQRLSQE